MDQGEVMKRSVLVLAGVLTVAAMGGCELKCRSEEGSGEKIGAAIDRAVDDIKDADGETDVKIKVTNKP
jgi:hypothetical protein